MMPTPRHDEWDPDHPDKGAHRKTADEFAGYIRDCIKELAPSDSEKVLTIPDLSQFLPDDDDSPEEGFEGEPDEKLSKTEGFERKPEEQEIEGRKMGRSRHTQPESGTPIEGDLETEEAGEGGGSGGGGGGGDGGGGDGNGGGHGDGKSKTKPGRTGGVSAKPTIPIRFRAFPMDLARGRYLVTVKPEKRVSTDALLTVSAVGDDSTSALEIASAKLANGKDIGMTGPGVLGPVAFPARDSLRIELILREPLRLALG